MPTELEELVDFLGSPRPEIRQIALEHLVGYSQGPQNSIFKPEGLKPINNLKVLVNDIAPRAKNALKILVNLSSDPPILTSLVTDTPFLETLLSQITNLSNPNADLISMLLANLAKSDSIQSLITLTRAPPAKEVSTSDNAMDQLLDLFVKGADKKLNKEACFDFLSYFFADVSRLGKGREYFVKERAYDGVVPISKVIVFTECGSLVRRKGVASAIKNSCFDIPSHKTFLAEDGINLLPYILLPIMGPEEYPEDEMLEMPPEVQLLPPDKERESDKDIVITHLETMLLLTSTREAREYLRKVSVYCIIREVHKLVEDDGVEEACDRIVQVLMRDEEPEEKVKEVEDEDEEEDDAIVEIL
ncbi:DUF383-domain-containing protein [Choiromyces venosus 120613-1]|uniref:Protein HGH1 homolog n=1 Tax=Choiromyces venosus 120613-1 TaxID=1336337 RepID=A0A3N4JGV0_9PEZI|nr:DUF383-domain-containing protein [Choiromyces venosus 120613-1]